MKMKIMVFVHTFLNSVRVQDSPTLGLISVIAPNLD